MRATASKKITLVSYFLQMILRVEAQRTEILKIPSTLYENIFDELRLHRRYFTEK